MYTLILYAYTVVYTKTGSSIPYAKYRLFLYGSGSGCGVHVVYRVARYDLLGRKLCQGFPSKDDNCKTVLFKRIFNEDHC